VHSLQHVTALRRALADGVGTALLLAVVVGSGIMGEKLAGGNDAIALLANSLATGFGLFALIVAFGSRSGAHFNPVVTALLAVRGEFPKREVAGYAAAQFAGAIAGVLLAHAMFDLPLLQTSLKARWSIGQWISEGVATFGLVFVVLSCTGERRWAAPAAIGAYIAAAYWFTASTAFANPAVTVARSLTATFAGIDPAHVVPFMLAQIVGGAAAITFDRMFSSSGSA
jgi:glycerol uptake facilitator-like aquaporin